MGTVKSPGKEFAISWRVKGSSEFKATESPFGHLVKAHSFVSLGQDLKHYLLNKIPDVVKQKNQGTLLRLEMNTWIKVFSQGGKMNLWLRAFAVQCEDLSSNPQHLPYQPGMPYVLVFYQQRVQSLEDH